MANKRRVDREVNCPCFEGGLDFVYDEGRSPESIHELWAAMRDGVPVHDLDNDCVSSVIRTSGQTVFYKCGTANSIATGPTYDRPLEYFHIPVDYAELPPVTDDEVAAAIASILSTTDD